MSSKTILVAGFGPGISKAVATRFGREGYKVALVARSADKVAAGAQELAAAGIEAQGFAADLGNVAEVTAVVGKARAALGPIAAIHWNAYASGAGDITTASPEAFATDVTIATVSLGAAVQASLEDLRAAKGAVLVTNGGLGFMDKAVNDMGVNWGVMGLSIANAAKRKLVALLAIKLAPDVFVGEVVVTGTVKGTAFDSGSATLDPSDIADRFWALGAARTDTSVTL